MERFGTDRYRTMYYSDSEPQFGRTFLEAFGFTEGLGAVRDGRGAYHIDKTGKPVSSARYRRAYPYRGGLAAVEDELGMFHIDKKGNHCYSERFGWVSDFRDGLCAAMYRNGTYTYIDGSGNAMSRTFRYASDFKDGTAVVLTEKGFTHIDTGGNPVHGKFYAEAHGYDREYAPVSDGEGWYLVDKSGTQRTEKLDRIDAGRNGLFAAVKDNVSGYLDRNLTFSELFRMADSVCCDEIPPWTDDILDRQWDACVVFMRHSERHSHFLCDGNGIAGTGLTRHGDNLAHEIGKKISSLKDRKISGYCSKSRRCVTTANCIMGGMGVSANVSAAPEVGPAGTAYISDNDIPEEEYVRPVILSIFQQLNGEQLKGWYSNERIRENLENMVRRLTEDDGSLTFCVNHDLFVIPPIAYATGRYARNDWTDYCDGCLFIRRGGKIVLVYDGKEYPFPGTGNIAVDTSFEPTGITMNLDNPDNVSGWQWTPPETIAWQGEPRDGTVTLCDREGRFFHGRSDGYLAYNRTFAFAGDFSEQSAPVYVKGRGASFVTDFGDYLHNRWFLEAKGYSEGLAPVRTEKGWQYADADGTVSADVFERAEGYNHGKALVFQNGKALILSRDGTVTEL